MSWKAETHPQLLIPISVLLQCLCVGYVIIVIILALDSPSLADCWLVERVSMCRDQIVTSFECISAFGIPRHIHCSCSTVMHRRRKQIESGGAWRAPRANILRPRPLTHPQRAYTYPSTPTRSRYRSTTSIYIAANYFSIPNHAYTEG